MSMMQFFRNREVKRELGFYGVFSLLTGVLFWGFWGDRGCLSGCVVVFLCALFHFFSEKKRYDRLAQMNEDIEQILHGQYVEILKDCREGELYILSTELNTLVRALKEQTEKAEEGKHFLAESMADISHQLKTPLTSMNLVISFLREPDLEEKKRVELSRELTKLTGKIEWLIYALLRISKLDAGTVAFEKRKVSLKKLFGKTKESIAIPLELREISWKEEIPEEIFIYCDAAWMEEAFGNLVKNCMEHTKAGGEISVRAEDNALYTSVFIKDTGSGFEKEDLPHIFEWFYRGKNAEKDSVGIGLALARKIILSQNGTITAANRRDGCGAEFAIRLYKTIV